jgi:hypothetical protein
MTFNSLQLDIQSYLERGTVSDPLVYNQLPELINFAERRISTEMKVLGFVVPASFTMQAGQAVYQKPDRWRKTISINVGTPKGTSVPPQLALTSVPASVAGNAVYSGAVTGGALNAFAGQSFTVTSFSNATNNGTYICTASTSSTLTLNNAAAVAETNPGVATQVSLPITQVNRTQIFPRSYEYLRQFWPDDSQTSLTTYGAPAPPKFYADYNYQNYIYAPTPDLAYPAELVYYEEPALLDSTNQTNFITQYIPNLLLYATLLECTPFLKKDDRIATWQAMYDRFAAVYNEQSSNEIIDRSTTRQET